MSWKVFEIFNTLPVPVIIIGLCIFVILTVIHMIGPIKNPSGSGRILSVISVPLLGILIIFSMYVVIALRKQRNAEIRKVLDAPQ